MTFGFILSVILVDVKGSLSIVFNEETMAAWWKELKQHGLPLTKVNLATPEFLNHKKREKCLAPDMVTSLKNLDRHLEAH